jgi:hypothetical protein
MADDRLSGELSSDTGATKPLVAATPLVASSVRLLKYLLTYVGIGQKVFHRSHSMFIAKKQSLFSETVSGKSKEPEMATHMASGV